MDQKGNILNWKLSLAETLSFGITIAVLVFFITNNFQSKEEGAKLENRIQNVERDLASLRSGVNQIAVDVSFIRGALTVPKEK